MAYSLQRDVSDGTLQYLEVRIAYFDKTHLAVFVAEQLTPQGTTPDPTSGYCWTWDGNRIKFNKVVTNGLEVMVRRNTPIAEPFHIFRQGAVFKDLTVDENFLQQLYINQENQEGQTATDFYSDLNFHGYRLRNVGAAVHDYDAVPFSQYRADALGAMHQRILTEQARDTAVTAKDTAVASKDAALVSQNAAKASETAAANSAAAALASQNAAATSAVAAAISKDAAKVSEDKAKGDADRAQYWADRIDVNNINDHLASIDVRVGSAGAIGWRNKIENGKMDISQRGVNFTNVTDTMYTLDRFRCDYNTTAGFTIAQSASIPSNAEFQNSMLLTVTGADTNITTAKYCNIAHFIEGYNIRNLISKPFTLSFWVRSSKVGIHCVAFRNAGSAGVNRSYIMEYTITAANAWEYKTITVAGGLPSTGNWNYTNGAGLAVCWSLAVGTTWQNTPNTWHNANVLTTANQVNVLDTVGNTFAITGIQLELGTIATPFEHRPYGTELALCQRYYCKSCRDNEYPGISTTLSGIRGVVGSALFRTSLYFAFPVRMRTLPSVKIYSTADGTVGQLRDEDAAINKTANVYTVTEAHVGAVDVVTSTFGASVSAAFTASAEL